MENENENQSMSFEEVVTQALMMDATIGQIIDNFYKEGQKSIVTDSSGMVKKLKKYLNSVVYNGKKPPYEAFMTKVGLLSTMISNHNNSYKISGGRGVKKFSNIEACGFETPLRISDKLDASTSKTEYRRDTCFYLKDIRDDFSEKALNNCSDLEIYAMVMHYTNKMVKYFEKLIEANVTREELKNVKLLRNILTENGVLSDQIAEYVINYSDFKDSKDDEIKEELGEDAFEDYKSVRKTIRVAFKEDEKLKRYEDHYFSGSKDGNYEKLINTISLINLMNNCYALKQEMMWQVMYEVEKGGDVKAKHYVASDYSKGEESNMNKTYNVMIDGYTEPFSVHISSKDGRIGENGAKGLMYKFSDAISLVQSTLAEKNISKSVEIPVIETGPYVKTALPFKKDKQLDSCLDSIINDRGIDWGNSLPSNSKDEYKTYNERRKCKEPPALAILKQSRDFLDVLDSKKISAIYSTKGIIEKESLKE